MDSLLQAYKKHINEIHGVYQMDSLLGPLIATKSLISTKRITSTHNRHQARQTGSQPKRCTCCKRSECRLNRCPLRELKGTDLDLALKQLRTDSLQQVSNSNGNDAVTVEIISYVTRQLDLLDTDDEVDYETQHRLAQHRNFLVDSSTVIQDDEPDTGTREEDFENGLVDSDDEKMSLEEEQSYWIDIQTSFIDYMRNLLYKY